MISTLQPASPAHGHGASGSIFGLWLDNLRQRRAARQTRKVLAELSDEQLTDIGLVRADIDAVALGATPK